MDLSWIVGLAVVAPLYYFAARLFRKTPEAAPFSVAAFASDLIEAPRRNAHPGAPPTPGTTAHPHTNSRGDGAENKGEIS